MVERLLYPRLEYTLACLARWWGEEPANPNKRIYGALFSIVEGEGVEDDGTEEEGLVAQI